MERVFVDANILYSRTIRDWLFALSTSKIQMFDLFSSEDVFAEVVYHYRRSNPKRSGDEETVSLIKYVNWFMSWITMIVSGHKLITWARIQTTCIFMLPQ